MSPDERTRDPSGGNALHLERSWRITMSPHQLLALILAVLAIAGYSWRFEGFVRQTQERLIRIEHALKIHSEDELNPDSQLQPSAPRLAPVSINRDR
jgi:hypothetical protein